eukprot:TRINITY_DN26406_c0_g1_i2.p1 TRINITY_DN26406_c0_g1~~TRINITY_DN26406_c0_g1_i2.p1  ORF type:complete len:580 (-),score=31.62 TRINITY_DN26406_c0_g1_i2:410-2149(-)
MLTDQSVVVRRLPHRLDRHLDGIRYRKHATYRYLLRNASRNDNPVSTRLTSNIFDERPRGFDELEIHAAAHFAIVDAAFSSSPLTIADKDLQEELLGQGPLATHLREGFQDAQDVSFAAMGFDIVCGGLSDPRPCLLHAWPSTFTGGTPYTFLLNRLLRGLVFRLDDSARCSSSAAMGLVCDKFRVQSDWVAGVRTMDHLFRVVALALGKSSPHRLAALDGPSPVSILLPDIPETGQLHLSRVAHVSIMFAKSQALAEIYCDVFRTLVHRLRKVAGQADLPVFALTTVDYMQRYKNVCTPRLQQEDVSLVVVGRGAYEAPWQLNDLPQLQQRLEQLKQWPPASEAWLKWLMFDPKLWKDYDYVLFLDSDTLPLVYPHNAFNFAASASLVAAHMGSWRHCEGSEGMNTGFVVAKPNEDLFTALVEKLETGWLLDHPDIEKTQNFDQTWFDLFMRHYSKRVSLQWPLNHFDESVGLVDAKLSDALTSSSFDPHVLLPESYNFFVDSFHVSHWLVHGELPEKIRQGVGAGTPFAGIRLLHWPGRYEEPWWRCHTGARSMFDDLWWDTHAQACSQGGCFLQCG